MGGKILTPLARAFKDDIQERMERSKLKDHFKDALALKLDVTVWTPQETFFTKDGKVSKTSIDFDAHKLFIDEVSKYFGFNDGLIVNFWYDKRPIEGSWLFQVEIMEIDKVWQIHKEDTVIGTLSSQGYHILD
jgi:hypothetical protein